MRNIRARNAKPEEGVAIATPRRDERFAAEYGHFRQDDYL